MSIGCNITNLLVQKTRYTLTLLMCVSSFCLSLCVFVGRSGEHSAQSNAKAHRTQRGGEKHTGVKHMHKHGNVLRYSGININNS